MKHARLDLARRAELLPALEGSTAVFGQINIDRLQGLEREQVFCVSHSFIVTEELKKSGYRVSRESLQDVENAVVFLPRSKSEAWHLIALARCAAPNGWIIVDGQKTDGIESVAKQISRKISVAGSYSKGHGKTIWFKADDAGQLDENLNQAPEIEGGFITAPGVFSSDGVDPASEMLLRNLPRDAAGQFCDLGAGWGYLSDGLLANCSSISALHLVEDNGVALDCARQNVTDSRAEFYWADALKWSPKTLLDGVIMNPPFHTGRNADPELGKAFIEAAARVLRPGGKLFMVANAHLPYEPVLEQCFTKYEVMARSNRFKVFCATRGRDKLV